MQLLSVMTPLKFVSGPSKLRNTKKLVIMLEEGRGASGKKLGDRSRPRVSSLAIKLNNFFQWSAAGCVLPYLSVYFLRYTQADSSHVGLVMSIAAVVGTISNFVLGSLSDRYQAHRQFYLISLILCYLSLSIMFVPMFMSSPTTTTPEPTTTTTTIVPQQEHPQAESTERPIQELPNDTTLAPPTATTEPPLEELQTIDQQQPVWFYIIGACIAFGSLSITTNQIFSDSFSANMARQCDSSFGSLRFYGALGWCLSNFILSTFNSYLGESSTLNVPYLLPGWLLFAVLSGGNIVLIACWPDKRPFDLSSSSSSMNKCGDVEDKPDVCVVRASSRGKPVVLVRAELLTFDALEESAAGQAGGQNMRRCSIAPLGHSHVIQQFAATPPHNASTSSVSGAITPPPQPPGEQHFKHITRVEPLESGNQLERQIKMFQKQQMQKLQVGDYERQRSSSSESPKQLEASSSKMSLRLHVKIIELIARRNSNLVRCMALYTVVGFVMSANWNFLFPYLELLDATKFLTISGYVMVSTYASETVFYYFSPWITSRVSAVNGLSAILIFLALRFAAYLTFTSPSFLGTWPLELMILVEALQSVTMGWFDCIFSEQALEFALEAEACVPRLIELGLMDDTREAREQVINGVKLSLMSMSSCFFDGVGVSIGSLIGGWLVGTFSFAMLWTVCVSIALFACAINVLLELTFLRNHRDQSGQRRNDNPSQNKYQT